MEARAARKVGLENEATVQAAVWEVPDEASAPGEKPGWTREIASALGRCEGPTWGAAERPLVERTRRSPDMPARLHIEPFALFSGGS